jgi:hypothetical protein
MAKKRGTSKNGRVTARKTSPTVVPPLRGVPYNPETRLSRDVPSSRVPNAILRNVTITNCGTGIRSENAVLDLQDVSIIDCSTGIDQQGGHIQGKRVSIKAKDNS